MCPGCGGGSCCAGDGGSGGGGGSDGIRRVCEIGVVAYLITCLKIKRVLAFSV